MTAMRTKIDCCKGCIQRQSGCHSVCEEYRKQKAELDESNAARRTQSNADAAYSNYRYNAKRKRRKKFQMRTRSGGKIL